jgi:hypothetical protein
VRVGASGGSNLKSAAFLNADGSVAVVVINSGSGAQTVNVAGVTVAEGQTARAWLTDNSSDAKEVAVTVGADGTASASVTGRGVISFLISPAAAPPAV